MRGRFIVGFALGVATSLGSLAIVGPGLHAAAPGRLERTAFEATVDAVLSRYYQPVDESAVLSAGLRAMLAELDPHSHFLSSDERKALRASTRGGATGLSVALRRDGDRRHLEILAVAPQSPAERAQLRPGDQVVKIGDRAIDEVGTQVEVELLLAGAVGEQIALWVQSPDAPEPRALELVLDKPRAKMVETATIELGDGRKFIHAIVRRFGPDSGEAFVRALASRQRLLGNNVAGIILDVRGNPGGEVDQALIVADRFIESGMLTRTRGRAGQVLREEFAHAAHTDTTTPLVVLQDRHSASASELLAVALQDHKRASIVGERSFGKGTVQEVLGLPDGSVASFTIARYFSPNDRPIDTDGVAPDVHVTLPQATPSAGVVDAGVRAAIDAFDRLSR